MFCEYCGKPVSDYAKYCRHCGATLEYYKAALEGQPSDEQPSKNSEEND